MILNVYSVLDGFVSLVRLLLAVLVLVLAAAALLAWRRYARQPDARQAFEDRCYLLFLLSGLLLVLNVVSWPLLYLLLDSYVSQWPGVMCVYGVTRIGTGSQGPARWLPALVTTLQTLKPVLVFASGAWFVLYLVNRRSPTAALTGRVLAGVLAVGVLALADAAVELAYLGIPKKEEFPSTGCCMEAFDAPNRASRFVPEVLVTHGQEPYLYGAYYALNAVLVLGLFLGVRRCRRGLAHGWLAALLGLAVLSLAVNGLFLVESAAPRLLRLPYHHCPYDLIRSAPEGVAAVALFVLGSFAVGWACVAGWLGRAAETASLLPGMVAQLLRLATLAYLASLLMLSLELYLA